MDEKQIEKLVNDLKDIEIKKDTGYRISDFMLDLDSTERFLRHMSDQMMQEKGFWVRLASKSNYLRIKEACKWLKTICVNFEWVANSIHAFVKTYDRRIKVLQQDNKDLKANLEMAYKSIYDYEPEKAKLRTEIEELKEEIEELKQKNKALEQTNIKKRKREQLKQQANDTGKN